MEVIRKLIIRLVLYVIISYSVWGYNNFAEYEFFDLPTTTLTVQSKIDASNQPEFTIPEFSTNRPGIDPRGLWITHNKYFESSGYWSQSEEYFTSTGMWIYHISGTPGVIADFGITCKARGQGRFIVSGIQNGGLIEIRVNLNGYIYDFGQIYNGWNFIGTGGSGTFIIVKNCNAVECYHRPFYSYTGTTNWGGDSADYMGYQNCSNSSVSYLIHSFMVAKKEYMAYGSSMTYSKGDTFNVPIGGDHKSLVFEEGDDGDTFSHDGGSSNGEVETGYNCTGGSPTSADTCYDICGDGMNFNTSSPTYGDDGNLNNSDGCDSSCTVEYGWECTGGTSNNQDTCIDICGDGIRVDYSSTTICDDGNFDPDDGGDATCNIEPGWICSGGTNITSDNCTEICGDGIRFNSEPNYGDDGNINNGDGCNSTGGVEIGWEGFGGTNITQDYCSIVCGNGILTSPVEECDDGNMTPGDGGSSSCKLEIGYSCVNDPMTTPATNCSEIGGDGIRMGNSGCDDGNLNNGDGGSSDGNIEQGYSCTGGSQNSPDLCLIICGDGISLNNDPTKCDDGNTISGDGGSPNCEVELGYTCSTPSLNIPHTGTEICGDGKRTGAGCDDGNIQGGDGCSPLCTVETGFSCYGGTATKKDTGVETGGDGKDYGTLECEDGNNSDGDGCASNCERETCYACYGGTPSSIDIGEMHIIGGNITEMNSKNIAYLSFNQTMLQTPITTDDLFISIISSYPITFSWTAEYVNITTIKLSVAVNTALKGTEILKVKILNQKIIGGPNGGCVTPSIYTSSIPSSLSSVAATAQAASGYTTYFIFGGILLSFAILMLCGASLELIWSLVNTLQLITYLPLMVEFYPDHVKVMFQLLEFVNMDIEFISDFVKKLIYIDDLGIPSYNTRFLENGIESPLFLDNCASLLFSLLMSILTLLTGATLYTVLKCTKIKTFLGGIISSYFFNNFLRFFTEGYLEIFFGSLLNIMALTTASTSGLISMVSSYVVGALGVLFPCMAFALLYDKRKLLNNDEDSLYAKRFGTMFIDFKTTGKWYLVQYYPIFLIRRLIFVVFLIVLIDYPELQCNSFILFSMLTFCYQALAKPFRHSIMNVLCCINEGAIFAIAMIQMVFITDMKEIIVVIYTGWMMISIMVVMIFLNISIVLIFTLVQKLSSLKSKSNKIKVDPVVTSGNTTFSQYTATSGRTTRVTRMIS